MSLLKQSTARNVMIFMTDSSDHVSGKTGLSAGLTIVASKNGGNFATITPTVTEPTTANGWYNLALDTTMTNTLGDLVLHITGAAADATDLKLQVVVDLPGTSAGASASDVATEVLDTQEVETGFSIRETMRLMAAALAGKVSGAATTTVVIRDLNDSKDRITATVDSNGNRSAVTKDVT